MGSPQPDIPPRPAGRLVAACILACSLLAFMAGPALALTVDDGEADTFTVSPMRYDVESSSKQQITLTNTQDSDISLDIEVVDFEGSADDPYAAPVLIEDPVSESPISGASWLNLKRSSITVPSNGTRTVNVDVDIPSSATGGHYAAVVFSAGWTNIGSTIRAKSRIGVLFFMNAGGAAPPDVDFENVYVQDPDTVIVDFTNPGDSAITPEADVIFEDVPIIGEPEVLEASCTETLPGSAGQCVLKLDDSSLAFGGGKLVLSAGDAEFTTSLPPRIAGGWKGLMLPLAGFAMLGWYFFVLRRRRTSEEDLEGDLAL